MDRIDILVDRSLYLAVLECVGEAWTWGCADMDPREVAEGMLPPCLILLA